MSKESQKRTLQATQINYKILCFSLIGHQIIVHNYKKNRVVDDYPIFIPIFKHNFQQKDSEK